ncbi:MAG: UDP-N-acetylmuramate dehydrogenase [Paludibacteraceae bacterium]|nr:UDP-N-acetylmuramate dehydrogenase [Paludibacteraceae bacterium]
MGQYIPNTFRMKVRARVWEEYHSVDEVRALLEKYRGERLLAIGAGSNLLFQGDFDGVVLHSAMRKARALDEDGEQVLIEAESGLVMDELIAQLCDMGLWGLENLSHIPGEVGASAVQNVGAYGVEAKDVIVRVNTIAIEDGSVRVFENADCHYAYRDSIFKGELKGQYIVTSVVYRLWKTPHRVLDYGHLRAVTGDEPTPMGVREAVMQIRRQKLPEVSELGSAGSFFKNPIVPQAVYDKIAASYDKVPHFDQAGGVKIPAAWLIEQCGWKGKRLGGAQVYEKQPLVIVNADNATPEDVMNLAQQICESVKEKFGISISPEVNYI